MATVQLSFVEYILCGTHYEAVIKNFSCILYYTAYVLLRNNKYI